MKSNPLIDARERRDNIAPEARSIYMVAAKIRLMIRMGEAQTIAYACRDSSAGSNIWAPENYGGTLLNAGTEGFAVKLAMCKELLAVIEKSAEYRAAVQIIEPILADVKALEEAELAERLEVARAEQALKEASLKAEAAMNTHPAVVAAKASFDKVKAALKFVKAGP